jgi:hypothetical protein
VTEEINSAIAEWVQLLGAGNYFAAHEVLEGPWLRAAEPEKTFLKGLIHVAVALHHHQRGNRHGARVKYRSAQGYLKPYQPAFLGVELTGLFNQLHPYFDGLSTLAPGAALPPPPASVRVTHLSSGHEPGNAH